MANNSPLYNQSVHLGHPTVADSIGDRFQHRYFPEQTPLDVSPNFANPMYRHMPTTDGQSYGTGLSWATLQKIQELKGLMNKYSCYHTNPDDIIRVAIYNSINGDDTLLDGKLEQLRSMDKSI
jgi:hypothetical protein